MRQELKALAKRIHDLELAGSTPRIIQEVRNTELKKLMELRKQRHEEAVAGIDATITEIRDLFNPSPKDDPVSLARHLRLDATYSAMPTNKLKALVKGGMKDIPREDLPVIGATLRKRGMAEDSDTVYMTYESRENEWKTSPYVQSLQNTKAKLILLNQDDGQLFIGSDIDHPTKEDFAQVSREGIISFKDDDGSVILV